MPHVTADDGVKLYYQEVGTGIPVVFVHEFAGDSRSWEAQLRHFGRRYRCIAYNARGYPPSDVPEAADHYSQNRARDDIQAVLDGLNIETAHIVGLSMGGFATLHFGFTYPRRARSLTIGGCGYGAEPDQHKKFAAESEATAARIEETGMAKVSETYALGPSRVQFQNNDPRGWQEFADQLAGHSDRGSANTLRGVQSRRPSLYDLTEEMMKITAPTLIITGDEDWACLAPGILMKKNIATAGLAVMPNCGHAINLEDPDVYNWHLDEFFQAVELGKWPVRDPRAMAGSILSR
jgi:pimeloyl-ACP methyl ester carboxylesterase